MHRFSKYVPSQDFNIPKAGIAEMKKNLLIAVNNRLQNK